MAWKSLFIIFLLSQLYLIYSSEIVSIPFKSFYKKGPNYTLSSIDDLAHSNLHSKINVGEPSYEIITFLSVHHSYFSMTPNHNTKNVNDFFSHYDISKSNSFKNITTNGRNLIDTNYDSVAKEKFELNIFNYKKNERYNVSIDDMIFIYNDDIKNRDTNEKIYYLNIGFQIINKIKYKERENYNFIHQLKKRNIIKNYDWCIFFERGRNENGNFLYNPDELIFAKGELLIGDLPSNYNANFHKSQLLTTYSIYNNFIKWAIEFSKIYYNKTLNDSLNINYVDVQLNINNYIILAPIVYFHNIKKDFFDYYISVNICKLYQGIEYTTFFCEKSNKFNIEHLKKFPTLYMDHSEFQYTFEFTYEDLFVEKDGKYWFLIALSSFNKDLAEWHMGIIFLRKYNLIFNQDSKTISFYNTNLPIINSQNSEKIYAKKNLIKYFVVLLVIIIIIICVVLVIIIKSYIRKHIFKTNKEKKRLNHIYDNTDFDYVEHENFDINKKDYNKQSILMEMKGLIYT